MPKYLPAHSVGGVLAIAVCPRCKRKIYYGELRTDPNTQQKLCKRCIDLYDPYRLAPRTTDVITLQYPRPDDEIAVPEE